MKHFWWKIVAVLLLGYVIVYSFTIPLAPNVTSLSPSNLKTGENTVVATGYNTQFLSFIGSIDAKITYEKKDVICIENIKVLDNNHLQFTVNVPDTLPSKNMHLEVSTSKYAIFSPEIVKVFEAKKGNVPPLTCTTTINEINQGKDFPNRFLLNETIRNLMFHVPMWFTMMIILLVSFVYSIKYLRGFNLQNDIVANQAVNIGLLFASLGLVTGMIWTKFTWSDHVPLYSLNGWWANDVKLNGAAISTLIYIAYRILRNSIEDEHQKAKVSAVYNIFAFVLMIVFIMVLPRLADSLHPGNGGNPAFSSYDLDSTLRMVFYPAVIGWILLGVWMVSLRVRLEKIKKIIDEK